MEQGASVRSHLAGTVDRPVWTCGRANSGGGRGGHSHLPRLGEGLLTLAIALEADTNEAAAYQRLGEIGKGHMTTQAATCWFGWV